MGPPGGAIVYLSFQKASKELLSRSKLHHEALLIGKGVEELHRRQGVVLVTDLLGIRQHGNSKVSRDLKVTGQAEEPERH